MTIPDVITQGLDIIKTVITFVTSQPLLLTGLVIGLAGYAIAVTKNSIR